MAAQVEQCFAMETFSTLRLEPVSHDLPELLRVVFSKQFQRCRNHRIG